jgi:hypothetical protein
MSWQEALVMPKQNFGAGTGVPDPPRQGEKGGKGGTIKKEGRSMGPGETGSNKSGKGAGSRAGGQSGGKATGGTTRAKKGNNVTGKGSGNG